LIGISNAKLKNKVSSSRVFIYKIPWQPCTYHNLGLTVVKNRKQDMSKYDIEKTRLIIAFPLILATCGFVIAYGWLMEYKIHVAAVLVIIFILANVITGALVANTALLTDINLGDGASLGAAMNLTRCLMGAGGVAAITPLINAIGIGYAATITAGIWVTALPALWLVYNKGYEWRKAELALEDETNEESVVTAPVQP
jgi:hypothetical protein